MIFQPNLIVNVVEPMDRGRLVTPYPPVTHYIGSMKYPLTTSKSSSVYQAHYSGDQPFSGPVKKLTFLQLGSCETPDLIPYHRTCKTVEFNGHINNTRTAFEIVSELPKVSKIAFLVGQSQQFSFTESFVEFYSQTPVCPHVKKLKIMMDLDYFHSYHHDCDNATHCNGKCLNIRQYSLICLVESILKHAVDSFPNLKELTVDLPEDERLCHAVQMLIQICPGLRSKTQTSVQNGPTSATLQANEYSVTFNGSYQNTFTWGDAGLGNSDESHSFFPCPSMQHVPNIHYEQAPLHQTHLQQYPCQTFPVPVPLHRPPPGFAPLSPISEEPLSKSPVDYDVHQRVSSWLTSLEV